MSEPVAIGLTLFRPCFQTAFLHEGAMTSKVAKKQSGHAKDEPGRNVEAIRTNAQKIISSERGQTPVPPMVEQRPLQWVFSEDLELIEN